MRHFLSFALSRYPGNMPGTFCALLLVLAVFLMFMPVSASFAGQTAIPVPPRTVHIVLDDSWSMYQQTRDRWWLAGYAVQTLASMLDEDRDEIVVHVMNDPAWGESKSRRAGSGTGSLDGLLKEIRDVRPPRLWTPITPVLSAVEEISGKISRNMSRSEDRTYWLIVTTDGEFNRDEKNREITLARAQEILKSTAQAFGRLPNAHSVFFLISDEADFAVAQTWRDYAGSYIIEAPQSEDIIPGLERIGRMITGTGELDPGQTDVLGTWDRERFLLDAELPLSRLMFLQDADGDRSKLSEPADFPLVNFAGHDFCQEKRYNIKRDASCSDQARFGRMTSLRATDGGAIPPSSQIELVWTSAPPSVRVFAEVSAVLDIELIEAGKTQDGWSVCHGHPQRLRISLVDPQSGQTISLGRPEAASVRAVMRASGREIAILDNVAWDKNANAFTGELKWRPGAVVGEEATLRVEASYPGYFQLHDSTRVHVARCLAEQAARLEVQLVGEGGRALDVREGNHLTNSNETVTVSLSLVDDAGGLIRFDNPEEARVWMEYLGQQIRMRHDPGKGRFYGSFQARMGKERLGVFMKPAEGEQRSREFSIFGKRDVVLDPIGDWHSMPDKLPAVELGLGLTINGVPAESMNDDYGEWVLTEITTQKDDTEYIRVDEIEKKDGYWALSPKTGPFWSPCYCKTGRAGEQTISAQAAHTYTGEIVHAAHVFSVEHVPWWKRCLPFALKVFIVIFVIWFLTGIITKNRFHPRSRIIRTYRGLTHRTALKNNFFMRYMIPYIPEKKRIGSILFIAGRRPSLVFVPGKTVKSVEKSGGKIMFGGTPASTTKFNPLRDNSHVTISRGSDDIEKYQYVSRIKR